MTTHLSSEERELARWRPKSQLERWGLPQELVKNEFLDQAERLERHRNALWNILSYSTKAIPRYSELRDGRNTEDPFLWWKSFPIITRSDLRNSRATFLPTELPPSEKNFMTLSTSGSTGEPVRVTHSLTASYYYLAFAQRRYRWFRFDPTLSFAHIRPSSEMPKTSAGAPLAREQTLRIGGWQDVEVGFETGPGFGYLHTNPGQAQLAWLEQMGPSYLLSQAANLEHLAHSLQSAPPLTQKAIRERLRGIVSVSQQMTPPMKKVVEEAFGCRVFQSYGLNEFVLVATQCPEGGNYHVHDESCLFEILDKNDQPVLPGETGRLVLTTLINRSMPLIRYDTSDLARRASGPCPCGRTLPHFENIEGRYRRIVELPEGAWAKYSQLQSLISDLSEEVRRPLLRYQVHLKNARLFELRLLTQKERSTDALVAALQQAWQMGPGSDGTQLDLIPVEEFVLPERKFETFTWEIPS